MVDTKLFESIDISEMTVFSPILEVSLRTSSEDKIFSHNVSTTLSANCSLILLTNGPRLNNI